MALARELEEEAGIAIRVGAFLGATEASFSQAKPKSHKGSIAVGHASSSLEVKSGKNRHHEINLLFAIDGLRRSDHPPLPTGQFPPVASLEDHIEFLWVPQTDLISRRPSLTILPLSIIPFLTRPLVQTRSSLHKTTIAGNAQWFSEWK